MFLQQFIDDFDKDEETLSVSVFCGKYVKCSFIFIHSQKPDSNKLCATSANFSLISELCKLKAASSQVQQRFVCYCRQCFIRAHKASTAIFLPALLSAETARGHHLEGSNENFDASRRHRIHNLSSIPTIGGATGDVKSAHVSIGP